MLMSDPSQDPETLERRRTWRQRWRLQVQFKPFLGLIGALVLIALGIRGLVTGNHHVAQAGLTVGGIAAALFVAALVISLRRNGSRAGEKSSVRNPLG
jgi:hypothetical protein